MAVDNPNVIDAVGTDRTTGEVVLTISDHLQWAEGDDHLLILQEKLNRYIGFLEAGELLESYPDAAGRPVRLDVVCRHQPNEDGERFLAIASATIQEAGWSLTCRWWPDEQLDA